MIRFRYVLANLHAAFMDVGVGIFLTVLFTQLFSIPFHWWVVPLGAVLGVLPDLDILKTVFASTIFDRPSLTNHHESYMHWPLFMIPIAFVIAATLGGWQWGVIVAACVLAHLLHDAAMMGTTYGARWFLRAKRRPIVDPSFIDIRLWIDRYWLRLSRLLVIETSIGAVAILLSLLIIASQIN